MNFSNRITIEDRPRFEAVASRLMVAGAITGALFVPLSCAPLAVWPVALGLISIAALLGPRIFCGKGEFLPLSVRIGALALSIVVGLYFASLPAACGWSRWLSRRVGRGRTWRHRAAGFSH